ncbi:MAG: DUF262 domain-containing protein [Porphyromonas sp.]|nr:DUF262 domain-containing protein [Porphyromonas sp.]
MYNTISTKALGELRDGRVFYVPAYQRGYRWTERQVRQLLEDLYSFVRNKDTEEQFYCLQPLIVRPLEDKRARARLREPLGEKYSDAIYEVVDGQQRLTTLYILLQCLIKHAPEYEKQYERERAYTLCYESRPHLEQYLDSLGSDEPDPPSNIDEEHVLGAYQEIERWVRDNGLRWSQLYPLLSELLQRRAEDELSAIVHYRSVRFIWYALTADKSVVREFLNINTGKIGLSDAELVKALFLQKRVHNELSKEQTLEHIALEWERMENALSQDDFWYFLSTSRIDPSQRIGLLLRLAHQERPGDKPGELFDAYAQYLEGKSLPELLEAVQRLWRGVVDTYRQLEDWYTDPIKYNMIGFLVHAGTELGEIVTQHEKAEDQRDFEARLEGLVKEKLRGTKLSDLRYTNTRDKHKIRLVLLLLNVHSQNQQLREIRKTNILAEGLDASTYKFPFGLYVSQRWDIEHIDSSTANHLRKDEDKKQWIEVHASYITEAGKREELQELQAQSKWQEAIAYIQRAVEEYPSEDEAYDKDAIGNLTLLDEATNRSYGNAIFPRKRALLLEAMRSGKYVLPSTQLVFYRNFGDTSLQSMLNWDDKSKKIYHAHIQTTLQSYDIE